METLEEDTDVVDHRLLQNVNISLPTETIKEILFRLPVKSILRFRSVFKPWLSHISTPSFTKLHLTHTTTAHRTALFISSYNYSTRTRHLLSAPQDGGPVTHLMTHIETYKDTTQAQHLNGLVFFTCVKWSFDEKYARVLVLNPSMHKIFKLPNPDIRMIRTNAANHIWYLFGFDESRNEHKILIITKPLQPSTIMEIMIFSMSSYSWKNIKVEPPVGVTWDRFYYDIEPSICVNSVVHILLLKSFDILAFDLRTEKFSIISTPKGVVPHVLSTNYVGGLASLKLNIPRIIKINGCIGLVCHDRVVENNEMHIWILQDYENRVWVKEIITFPQSWIELGEPLPLDSINKDEIIFTSSNLSRNHVMSVLVYNMKSSCSKSLLSL